MWHIIGVSYSKLKPRHSMAPQSKGRWDKKKCKLTKVTFYLDQLYISPVYAVNCTLWNTLFGVYYIWNGF